MQLSQMVIGGVPCVLCEPTSPAATLLWFHGGGFRYGSAVISARFGMRIAAATEARVVLVDYALAPEHPFPAALHDAVSVFTAALDRWPGTVFVGGDSAGGGLAVALGVAAGRVGAPLPMAEILLSPWCDLTISADSYESNGATDHLFSVSSAAEAADLYLQGWQSTDPLASPLFADLTGFPSTLVLASTDEVLLDDSLRLAGRLAAVRTDVAAHFVPGVQHVWPTLDPDAPASVAALAEVGRFVSPWTRLGRMGVASSAVSGGA
jgi:epsilon-lactone hydrolase